LSIIHLPLQGVDEEDNGNDERQHQKEDDIDDGESGLLSKLEYDPEWLAIVKKTHHLTKTTHGRNAVSSDVPSSDVVTPEEVEWVINHFGSSLEISNSYFEQTVPPHIGAATPLPRPLPPPLPMMGNPQTDRLLNLLELDHITTVPYARLAGQTAATSTGATPFDENEICVDEEDDDDEVSAIAAGSGRDVQDENEIDLDDDDDTQGVEVPSTSQGPGIGEISSEGASNGEQGNSPKKLRVDDA